MATTSTSMVTNSSTMISSREKARYITQPGRDNATDTACGCCSDDGESDGSDSFGDEGSVDDVADGSSASTDVCV